MLASIQMTESRQITLKTSTKLRSLSNMASSFEDINCSYLISLASTAKSLFRDINGGKLYFPCPWVATQLPLVLLPSSLTEVGAAGGEVGRARGWRGEKGVKKIETRIKKSSYLSRVPAMIAYSPPAALPSKKKKKEEEGVILTCN